jgi:hypothetical protein
MSSSLLSRFTKITSYKNDVREEVDDLPVVMERFDFSLPPLFFVGLWEGAKSGVLTTRIYNHSAQ